MSFEVIRSLFKKPFEEQLMPIIIDHMYYYDWVNMSEDDVKNYTYDMKTLVLLVRPFQTEEQCLQFVEPPMIFAIVDYVNVRDNKVRSLLEIFNLAWNYIGEELIDLTIEKIRHP